MKYTIVAECKTYSEWSIDENGKPTVHEHDFEGVDVVGYKIIRDGDDCIFDHEDFEVVKAKLLELNNNK